jgi:hypothetical protein
MTSTVAKDDRAATELTPARAFALLLETACEQFEVLQAIVSKELQFTFGEPNDPQKRFIFRRAPYCVQAALAKSFVANVIRAQRICEHGAQHLTVDRAERTRFLKSVSDVLLVRNVNEHGFDVGSASAPSMHARDGGLLDETAMIIRGPERILMGPVNLYDVYRAAARMRDLAGFNPHSPDGTAILRSAPLILI